MCRSPINVWVGRRQSGYCAPPTASSVSIWRQWLESVGGDELVDLVLEHHQYLVVGELPEQLGAAFEVDEVGRALQPKVGVIGFARAVDPAAHDRDGDLVPPGVGGDFADFVR